MKIYDITATIGDSLPGYGNESFTVERTRQLEKGHTCNVMRLGFTTHTGTHADTPLHFIAGGASCDTIALEHFYGEAKLFRIKATAHITKEDLLHFSIEAGDIVLLDTGQSHFMRQKAFHKDFFGIAPCAAAYLAEKKIKTLGIDYLSIDPYGSRDFAAHKILLGEGIALLEGLVLENVPEGTYTLSALPLKIEGGDGSPVRAVLVTH